MTIASFALAAKVRDKREQPHNVFLPQVTGAIPPRGVFPDFHHLNDMTLVSGDRMSCRLLRIPARRRVRQLDRAESIRRKDIP